jgi:predicted acylesterase/phospholipase RssA
MTEEIKTDNNKIPQYPFKNIAISLSGGGYAAASFHLGTLSYLHKLSFKGENLLKNVRVLSTVSGGTFTGVRYILSLKNGESFDIFFNSFYEFMKNIDLIKESLKKLENEKNWENYKSKSLINAFAETYYEKFTQDKFEILWDYAEKIHVKEIIFNATEFKDGLTFRFQKTGQFNTTKKETKYGLIGNYFNHVSATLAKKIRFADIIAASSCFPAAFEPINFPNDFIPKEDFNRLTKEERKKITREEPIGLMDGGIVDNQGIHSVRQAEERMRKYITNEYISKDNAIDLYIISDVSSPKINEEDFILTKENKNNWWRKLSLRKLRTISIFLLALSAFLLTHNIFFLNTKLEIILSSVFFTLLLIISGLIYFSYYLVIEILPKKLKIPSFFTKKLAVFLDIKFGVYETMIKNRVDSILSMVTEVFMRQIRRLSYNKIYEDKRWNNRLIMNAIYELTKEKVQEREKKRQEKKQSPLPKNLSPTKPMQDVIDSAMSMKATLWFKPEDLEDDSNKNKLNSLIAAGQFNICFNLIEYIISLKENKSYNEYDDKTKQEIEDLYKDLEKDWENFKIEPFWLFNKIISSPMPSNP